MKDSPHMKRRRLLWLGCVAGASMVLVACGDDGNSPPESSAGSAGTNAAGSGSNQGGGAGASGSGAMPAGASGSGSGGGELAACGAAKPDTSCGKDALCASVSCGMLTSQLSSMGCMRKVCAKDADCGADELCFPGPVVAQVDATSPRFAPTCTANGTRCDCAGLSVESGAKAYCAPKADVFAGFGCLTRPSVKNDCAKLEAWIAGAEALLMTLTLEQTVATTAQSCITQAADYHAENCP